LKIIYQIAIEILKAASIGAAFWGKYLQLKIFAKAKLSRTQKAGFSPLY